MIDLHTHTLFSDGELIPSELVYRAKVKGYEALALTDHVDFSNIDWVIYRIKKIVDALTKEYKITVIPGAELTYVPPNLISKGVKLSRKLGAKIVVVHGETTAETVPPGTNRAGILSGADIIAHPGLITKDEVRLAAKRGVYLEITSRKGHRKTNNHVYRLAKATGARLVFNTDTHKPENLIDKKGIKSILSQSKISKQDFIIMQNNAIILMKNKL